MRPLPVRELELDLDAFEGPFDLLLTLLLKEELEPREVDVAAIVLAFLERLAEYRRMKEAAAWLVERLASEGDRWFRLGPAPLAPAVERKLAARDPAALADALRGLAKPPPNVSLEHMALRFPPVSQFLERFRALLVRRRRFDFDSEVSTLSRVEQAVALLALLELRKSGEIALSQAAPFAPIRVSRHDDERIPAWTARSA